MEKYEGVTVTLTRDDDETVELEERTEIALDENADVLISLHNNSTGPCCPYDNGSTVLVAKGNYNTEDETKEQMAEEEQKLGCNILNELEAVGLTNQGLCCGILKQTSVTRTVLWPIITPSSETVFSTTCRVF